MPSDRAAERKRLLLNLVSEVKARLDGKVDSISFPIPQFIVVGKQSVGKSRLIEAFAGEPFNFVSGTLGSRRPTVLEFRNVPGMPVSRWSVFNEQSKMWMNHPVAEVMHLVGQAHESLGNSVTEVPIRVKVEGADCTDLGVVDLPGFRAYAKDAAMQELSTKIDRLVLKFMNDENNVMLCVEEAGDAAGFSTLGKCKQVDPSYRRTILIRNKLDKYYGDLTNDNINRWLEGFGDLPKNLQKFALTLPHWQEGTAPPKRLGEMRDEMDAQDVEKLQLLGASKKFLSTVGFKNFARFMEKRIERMFVEAIGPVLTKLRDLEGSMQTRASELSEELETSDPASMLATVRACGMSFANCLNHVLEGFIRSDINRMTLDDELREFHSYHQKLGDADDFLGLPSEDFGSLDDYIEYLRGYIKVPAFEVAINGGAQFRRLMFEVETFLRFSEIGIETKKRDVLQSFGISMSSVTWREVVVKLLNHDAHLPLQKRVKYVGQRVKWFFEKQKDPIVQFMKSLKGSPDEKIYSVLYSKHAKMLEENLTIRKLVFDTFDNVVARQLQQFVDLFKSTLHATFSNPWVFLKKTTARLDDDDIGAECLLPSLDDTKARIPQEIQSRTGIERTVTKWLYDIPMEPHRIDEAVDQVQLLVLKVYSHIRSQVCDQVELFAESFFKLPLMRRLEEDMIKVELSEVDKEGYRVRREKLLKEANANAHGHKEVKDCLRILSAFALKKMSQA
mmetsp:Transcript_43829/g.124976  ORF Transcript_43829/g.124976 Transcript_43829/m.124976 type:complete len:731 (+) Transcript_43829:75-2267(+)